MSTGEAATLPRSAFSTRATAPRTTTGSRKQPLGPGVAVHLVHTAMPVDAHQEDALVDIGGDEILVAGAAQLSGLDSISWACTSGSFAFGWEGAGSLFRASVHQELG